MPCFVSNNHNKDKYRKYHNMDIIISKKRHPSSIKDLNFELEQPPTLELELCDFFLFKTWQRNRNMHGSKSLLLLLLLLSLLWLKPCA